MFDFATDSCAPSDPDLSQVATGLVAGTKVATQIGWRGVEAVSAGDLVLTFDGGFQIVTAVTRQYVRTAGAGDNYATWPMVVPADALGNREAMTLLPQQAVLVESDTAEAIFGDPFAMIPASALDGFRGIYRAIPADRMEVITLHFAQDEVVFANIGALFHCPATTDLLNRPVGNEYHVLGASEADLLVQHLVHEDSDMPFVPQAPYVAA